MEGRRCERTSFSPLPLPLRVVRPAFALASLGRGRLGDAVCSASFAAFKTQETIGRWRHLLKPLPISFARPRRLTLPCCHPALGPCSGSRWLPGRPAGSPPPPPAKVLAGCRCTTLSSAWSEAELRAETLTGAPGLPWTAPAIGSMRTKVALLLNLLYFPVALQDETCLSVLR